MRHIIALFGPLSTWTIRQTHLLESFPDFGPPPAILQEAQDWLKMQKKANVLPLLLHGFAPLS
jgi:hypothetical protein